MSLVYLTAHGMARDSQGRIGLPTKTVSALAEYAARWNGDVFATSMAPPCEIAAGTPGMTWHPGAARLGVRLVETVSQRSDFVRLGARLLQIQTTAPHRQQVMGLGFPVLLTDDNSPAVRRALLKAPLTSRMSKLRSEFGHRRRQIAIDRDIKRAAGLQCNGFAAYNYYSAIRDDALRFFDHRIRKSDIEEAKQNSKGSEGPFRIAFSGRLLRIKGVHLLPEFMHQLEALGSGLKIEVFGDGPLLAELQESVGARATLHGFVEFDPDWKAMVRENVNLMVLPHIQGDSSSTYYESLGMGVPVIGFANDTLTPLRQETGAAWTVRMGDVAALARAVDRLSKDPARVAAAGKAGLSFMGAHTMELEFDRRLEHMATLIG